MTVTSSDRLARLPIKVSPRLGETTDSYIRRLARANHLKPSYLHRFLCGPPFWFGKPILSRLAAVSGHPERALQRALADVASPRRRTKPNVRYPRAIPLADRPELALRIREAAQSGNATIRDLSRRHKLPPRTIRTILDMPAPSTYQPRSGPRKGRPTRRPAAAINDSTRALIDAILAEHLDLREVWTRLMDDHDISVSYSSINIYFRTCHVRTVAP
ncbi:TniQ family protein [Streptomyces sp. TRM68367]|uniref:TniQ family protein n=1 Tax=Streptomyces sp. TRM68367 TaxID=2758415 RepID=UPI00165C9A4C|nr:TniQ family protein [Streptomyces sp. TRM68367]MBC9730831.1 TniQ family protein [Streptomyces sp. TRM68367]